MWRARRPPVNVVAGRLHMSLPSNAHAGGPQAQLACPHLMAGMTSSKIPWHPPVHPKQPGGSQRTAVWLQEVPLVIVPANAGSSAAPY